MTLPPSDPPPGPAPGPAPGPVADDLGEAIAAFARGEAVVLLTSRSSAPDDLAALAALRELSGPVTGGGRVALFVGERSEPADRELAAVMAEELFHRPG